MQNEPLISVIIPAYNAEKTLKKCVESITAQRYSKLEIIIVNDCSTDGTLALAQSLAAQDKRVHVFSTPQNSGPSQSRNLGLEAARGEWITFADSDDWLEPDTYESALLAAEKNKADSVTWSYWSEYGENKKEKHIFDGDRVMTNREMLVCILGPIRERLAHPEHIHSLSPLWSKLFRASVIRQNSLTVREIKEIGSEDLFFCAEFAAACEPDGTCVYLDRCLYHYIKGNTASVTGKYRADYADRILNCNRELEKLCAGRADAELCRAAVNNRAVLCMINIGLNEMAAKDGAMNRIRRLSAVMKNADVRSACTGLTLQYFPLKWKLFFFCVKHRLSFCLYVLLLAMLYLMGKHD